MFYLRDIFKCQAFVSYSVSHSYVKETSGDRGQNTYKHLEWPRVFEIHASWNDQGAEKGQPRIL